VAAFIADRASPPGKKMGHAGAIVTGSRGSYASKRRALESAGARVADTPGELAQKLY
jgi:succinyl-CoA synthetase alpha subunit